MCAIQRMTALGMALALVCSGAWADAEAAAPAASSLVVPSLRETIQAQAETEFSFRSGIHWNMSPEQVQTLENTPMTTRSSGDWSVSVAGAPVEVSRFTADLVFMFYQNQLKMITYEFQSDGSALSYQYLIGALCSVYGDLRDADPAVIKALMDQIYPDRYRTELISQAHAWTAPDGTGIYLYYFTANAFAILYTPPEFGSGNAGGYAVNGL